MPAPMSSRARQPRGTLGICCALAAVAVAGAAPARALAQSDGAEDPATGEPPSEEASAPSEDAPLPSAPSGSGAPGEVMWVSQPTLTLISRTIYQGSQIRLYDDDTIDRFRNLNLFAEWLDVSGWSLGPEGQFDAVVSVRYRADFGTGFHRDTPVTAGIPAVDGAHDLQLPYAYVDWRDVIDRRLDLRLGRQLLTDDLDWFSLDGVKATLWVDRDNYFEVYAGQPVPFDTFLSSDSFLYDGTEIIDGPNVTVGGSGHFRINEEFAFSLAYRHTFQFRGTDIEAPARLTTFGSVNESDLVRSLTGGTVGVEEATLGLSAAYIFRDIDTELYGHGVYSFLFGSLDQARLGANFTPRETVRLELEYLRVQPRFAADSIFNYFNIKPYDRGRFDLALRFFGSLWLDAGYFVHAVHGDPKGPIDDATPGGEGATYQGNEIAHGPRVELEWRAARWRLGAAAEASTNFSSYAYGGNYRMLEGYGQLAFLEDRFVASLRLNYTGAQSDWFEGIDAGLVDDEIQSLGMALGARAQITDQVLARVDFIKNFGSVIEGSYRLQSLVEVRY